MVPWFSSRACVLCGIALLAGTPGAARAVQGGSGGTDHALVEQAVQRATRLIEGHRRALDIPGMQVAVSLHGTLVWSAGFGLADIEQQSPVTPLTRFRIGSVSKTLTSAAVARLVESGRLDLDAPIQAYVPTFPKKRWPITARELGGHLAGIRHYVGRAEGTNQHHYASVTEALRVFRDDSLLFEPGTRMFYSSYGYNLLSAVIEGAAGMGFLTFMQDSVFTPLGMRSTGPDLGERIIPYRSAFYARGPNRERINAPYDDLSVKWAGGGMLSTAEDLVRFAWGLWHGDLVRPETAAILFTTQHTSDGSATGYGIGWEVGRDAAGRRLLSHGGVLQSGRADLLLYPDQELCLAVLSNTGERIYFGAAEAQEVAELFLNAEAETAAIPVSEIDAWAGLWRLEMESPQSEEMVGAVLDLVPDGGDLHGWLTIPSLPGSPSWTVPLAFVTAGGLAATAVPGSHLLLTLQRNGESVAGSWHWVSAPFPPGMVASMPPEARRMMADRGRPKPVHGHRWDGGPDRPPAPSQATEAPPQAPAMTPDTTSGSPVGVYAFEADFNGNRTKGTIVIESSADGYRGRIDAGNRTPLTISAVTATPGRLVIETRQGLTFALTLDGDAFQGTIAVGGNQVPVRGTRQRP